MKLTTVSNYINHHQIPLSNEFFARYGIDYTFIQTEPMEEDRVAMGWGKDLNKIPYLKLYYEDPETCKKLIMESDIVIFGGVDDESYIKPRLQAGKIVIRSSERLYKEGQWKSISPRGRKKKYEDHTQYADSPVYLLCNGAYVASDFNIVKAYPNKKYTWGYFPEVKEFDLDKLFLNKLHINDEGKRTVKLLWAGRFIDWKHPEYAIKAAKKLKEAKYEFTLDIVGGGPLEEKLKSMAKQYGLESCVKFRGFLPPKHVREYMEKADIYLFTSDFKEGWGAVLNESMNSACAVVAGAGLGAAPYLIKDGQNGYVYKNGHFNEFYKKLETLVKDEKLRRKLGENAYNTMVSIWNPIEAASRLMTFMEGLLEDKIIIQKDDGPMSMALDISPRNGYNYATRKIH